MSQDGFWIRHTARPIRRYSTHAMAVVAFLYAVYGLLLRDWKVSDLFFWFWCEFLISALYVFVVTRFYWGAHPELPSIQRYRANLEFALGLFMLTIYITMFTAIAYRGEWGTYSRLPQFMADKTVGLIGIVASSIWSFWTCYTGGEYAVQHYDVLTRPFHRKCLPILFLYAVLMFQYHWTGSTKLDLTRGYLKEMGLLLVTGKLLVELGAFSWLRKHLPARKMKSALP